MPTQTAIDKPSSCETTCSVPESDARSFRPNVDIVEGENEFLLRADLPGTRREDIDIRFDNGSLTLSGRVQPRQSGETKYLLTEYGVGDFHREFRLGESLDPDGITAEHAHGVLTIRIPKSAAAATRRIPVQLN